MQALIFIRDVLLGKALDFYAVVADPGSNPEKFTCQRNSDLQAEEAKKEEQPEEEEDEEEDDEDEVRL